MNKTEIEECIDLLMVKFGGSKFGRADYVGMVPSDVAKKIVDTLREVLASYRSSKEGQYEGELVAISSCLQKALPIGDVKTLGLLECFAGVKELVTLLARLRQHVADLQSGMYINCVYCGHRYGPKGSHAETVKDGLPMAEALRQHIEQCPEHPMNLLVKENQRLRKEVDDLQKKLW